MNVVGIIPARLASTRLPRKLLLNATGRPLLQYTWEAACRATLLDEVIIATDSEEIRQVADEFGARCEMTGQHSSGTDRVAEVARRSCSDASVIVNIQGDEPELDPGHIDSVVGILQRSEYEMATLAAPIDSASELHDASCTKVVCAADGQALYFSRAAIPHARDEEPEELLGDDSPWLLHIGLYAYRFDYLMELTQLPPGRLEQLEKLEQLRAIEAGARIQVAKVEHRAVGIDTPEDYARFVARVNASGESRRAG